MHDICIVCTVHWEPDEQKIQFLMNTAFTLSLTIAIPTLLALRNGRFFLKQIWLEYQVPLYSYILCVYSGTSIKGLSQ